MIPIKKADILGYPCLCVIGDNHKLPILIDFDLSCEIECNIFGLEKWKLFWFLGS